VGSFDLVNIVAVAVESGRSMVGRCSPVLSPGEFALPTWVGVDNPRCYRHVDMKIQLVRPFWQLILRRNDR
jgi:hypothetical protein